MHDLTVTASDVGHARLLSLRGILDAATYRQLRDVIVKAALDRSGGVIVDVDELSVPVASALTVFTSARWLVSTWPDVPVLLVASSPSVRDTLRANGITRYVPVYANVRAAVDGLPEARAAGRHYAHTSLARPDGLDSARRFVADCLDAWGQQEMTSAVATVAMLLVDNVLEHTWSDPRIRLEMFNGLITVAVADRSQRSATRREGQDGATDITSGLGMVSTLTRSWGSAPTPEGKTVWAVLGPENRL